MIQNYYAGWTAASGAPGGRWFVCRDTDRGIEYQFNRRGSLRTFRTRQSADKAAFVAALGFVVGHDQLIEDDRTRNRFLERERTRRVHAHGAD